MDSSDLWRWDSNPLATLFMWGCSMAMIFGGVVPYIPQYRDIRRSSNADGFSLYVCLALLISNTLRILFWVGHPFELPLLFQSIVMIVTMFVMVHMCVNVRNKTMIIKGKDRLLTDFDWSYFWEWTDFLSYVEFIASFATAVGFILYLFINISPFVELVGFLSVFVEAMLGVPQFYRNCLNKSTVGMSKKMVVMWTLGDTYKTLYLLLRSAPVQFWTCAILQVCIDISILGQVFLYRSPPVVRLKSAAMN